MANFRLIDVESWDRKENFNWFVNHNKIKMNMTTNVDITSLLQLMNENGLRKYATFAWIVSKIVNSHDYFRMAFKGYPKSEELGIWDVCHPRYPVFHPEDEKISVVWTNYSENFHKFYDDFLFDMKTYTARSLAAKTPFPPNFFDLTSLPWASFSDFHCTVYDGETAWLLPTISIGKFFEFAGKIFLPVNLSINHAVCDGYHVCKFFNEFEQIGKNFSDIVK